MSKTALRRVSSDRLAQFGGCNLDAINSQYLNAPASFQMTNEERQELNRLCKQIAVEKDHQVFSELLLQLNKLLERKEERLEKVQT